MNPTPSPSVAPRLRPLNGLLLALLGLLASCSSPAYKVDPALGEISRVNAGAYLQNAQADLDAGDLLGATRLLIELRQKRGLVPEELYQTDHLLNLAATRLFQRVEEDGSGSEGMRYLFELRLPARLRASAGLRMAELLFEEGHPVQAYRAVTNVERKLPNHPMRQKAAEVLARTGTYMLEKGGTYNLIFSYKARGAAALEFLVERYTSSKHCAPAYALLAQHYEADSDYDLALERWENLILYHGEHELVPEATARMPYLRLVRMQRDDYSRQELLRAKQELERWLSYYPDLEQAAWVAENLAICHERLAQNDLGVARFYRQINAPLGARLHAERALVEAKLAKSEDTIARIEALLAKLPPAPPESFGIDPETPAGAPAGTPAGNPQTPTDNPGTR